MLDPLLADLLPRIPLSARTILDVGCGTGTLARAYRALNPTVRLLGLERDGTAAREAARHLDSVTVADLAANPVPAGIPGGIDCIIYASVLEGLGDPWTVIRRHAELLAPEGIMLISLPNPGHWRTAESLLRGDSEDEVPLAVFPEAQVQRQLYQAGLSLCDVIECQPDQAGANRFADALAPGLEALGIDAADYARRAASRRLLWRVRKQACDPLILAGNMLPPIGGVSHLRVVHPLQAVGTDPSVQAVLTDVINTDRYAADVPRIFVLHRPALAGEHGRSTIRRLTEAGYLIVTEFDDHPDHFPMMAQGGDLTFRGVHALQTSTPALAEVLRRYNDEIAVFPNGITALPEVRNFQNPDVMTVFFGALNREADWEPYMPVLNEIASLARERLRFEVIHDRGFFDALATPCKSFTPTCDYDTYLRILGGCEISFMPLGDTSFNRCKSDLKFIEAGACRLASLGSPIVYANSMRDGQTGVLFRSPDELRRQLLRLLALPALARQLGDNARDYVRTQRMLAYQVAPRIAWYRLLWERRDELRARQQERLGQYFQHAA